MSSAELVLSGIPFPWFLFCFPSQGVNTAVQSVDKGRNAKAKRQTDPDVLFEGHSAASNSLLLSKNAKFVCALSFHLDKFILTLNLMRYLYTVILNF